MTVDEMIQFFEDRDDMFLRFEDIETKLSTRPDLHAFILLDTLCPGTYDMVSGAEHDEIWLSPDIEVVADKATEEQLVELIRCGVRIWEGESFHMFA